MARAATKTKSAPKQKRAPSAHAPTSHVAPLRPVDSRMLDLIEQAHTDDTAKFVLADRPSINFGDPRLPDRFWSKAIPEPNTGCWLWIAASTTGYGCFWNGERNVLAHRLAYETLVASTDEPDIDHLCRTRCCINPAHLEPVSHLENIFRSPLIRANGESNRIKTCCPVGHEYTLANTYVCKLGKRMCRMCQRDRMRERRAA